MTVQFLSAEEAADGSGGITERGAAVNEFEMEDFFLFLVYKNKTMKFRIVNPDATLSSLMYNLRHATGKDGKLIFDFPSLDPTGAPLDYFFGKEDPQVHEIRVMRPKIGKSEQKLIDYGVQNGDTVFIIPDPFPG